MLSIRFSLLFLFFLLFISSASSSSRPAKPMYKVGIHTSSFQRGTHCACDEMSQVDKDDASSHEPSEAGGNRKKRSDFLTRLGIIDAHGENLNVSREKKSKVLKVEEALAKASKWKAGKQNTKAGGKTMLSVKHKNKEA
jgi:hypothetical protein